MKLFIRPAEIRDAKALTVFADAFIGPGYYTEKELEEKIHQSEMNSVMCSFVLEDRESGQILGLRLTFPPGNWSHGKGSGLHTDKWNIPIENVGCFQSLFLSSEISGQGWGPKMSLTSLSALRRLGALAVVAQSWVESPYSSSRRYLERLGFKTVGFHPRYWYHLNYECPLCGRPCLCTAEEMLLIL